MERLKIIGKTMDQERSLYGLSGADVVDCVFAGPADGESALKESRDVHIKDCRFDLRYPMWHCKGFTLEDSVMSDTCRAAIWYAGDGRISGSALNGIKALRECHDIIMDGCHADSKEFGWRCRGLRILNSQINSEYFLFENKDIEISNLKMTGKYSFQYVENGRISDSFLDTKDAFWHCRNLTVTDSVIKGEYLAWYSDGLTLINCKIIGTQPLCYCTNLKLVNCTMEDTDLSFEYSDVQADIKGSIVSVKNPRSGSITADSIGAVMLEGSIMDGTCRISTREQ